ncbi:MAG TPA: pitrilysin family protein, partial [Gemmatimonadaceae bacterium]|nr:pitrilysin family protein [Gemmatimonadaceae bacterium]
MHPLRTARRLHRRTAALVAAASLALVATLPLASASAQTPRAPAASPAAAADTLPLDSAVRFGVLPNGLRYYVRVNHRPEKRAELRLVVDAGSVLEDEDQRGLAHFVEHMAFNGTTHFARNELVNYLESIGMSFGADLNAATSFDETVYQLTVPTDSGKALDKGLLILEDWAHGLRFDHDEIARERGVVEEEWRLGQGAASRIRDKQFPVLFQGSRYATRLPIGTKASLDSASDAALKRFYADWYRPDLMAVVAVGDFDGAAVEKEIRRRFSTLANPPHERPRPSYSVPDHDAPLVAIATDREATGTSVEVIYLMPPRPANTVATYRRGMIEGLYDAMFNERLNELARRPNPPFIGAGSNVGRLIRAREVYSIGAAVSDSAVERGLAALLTEAERVDKFGFTQGELDRARADLLRSYDRAFAEREKTYSSSLVDEYVNNFLIHEPSPGIGYEVKAAHDFLPTVTLADVNAVGREL